MMWKRFSILLTRFLDIISMILLVNGPNIQMRCSEKWWSPLSTSRSIFLETLSALASVERQAGANATIGMNVNISFGAKYTFIVSK
jgi:ubiquitin-protein ligase